MGISWFVSDNKIEFASFLEAMHDQSSVENPEKELMNAFKAHDKERRSYVNASEIQHIMMSMGERLSRQEGRAYTTDCKLNCLNCCL